MLVPNTVLTRYRQIWPRRREEQFRTFRLPASLAPESPRESPRVSERMTSKNNQTLEDELSKIDEISEARSLESIERKDGGQTMQLRFDHAVWGVWWAGTILIVLSWIDVVSDTVGWIGFAATVASTVVSVVIRRYWRLPR